MSISSILFIFSSSFMAFFPVINPLGTGFIVNGFLTGLDAQQRKSVIKKLIINFLLIGIGSLLVGHLLLLLFGLAIPVIQFGGGLLICKTAIGLLSDTGTPESEQPKQELDILRWKDVNRKLFYPITFPISLGPGDISVIFTLMASGYKLPLQVSLKYFIYTYYKR